MARHYRQNKKDRMDESRGMRKYEKGRSRHEDHPMHGPHHDPDALMLPRDSADEQNDYMGDHTQMYHMGKSYYGPGYGHPSNLPPYPDIKYYPKGAKYLRTGDYPDTIGEIDHDGIDNVDNLNHQPSKSMY